MERLRSPNEFLQFQERLRYARDPSTPVLVISAGTCGQASGANDLIRVAKRELLKDGLGERVHLRVTGCHGYCQTEPSVLVEPQRTFYPRVTPEAMVRIIAAVAQGETVDALLYADQTTGKRIARQEARIIRRKDLTVAIDGGATKNEVDQRLREIRATEQFEQLELVAAQQKLRDLLTLQQEIKLVTLNVLD